MHVTRLLRQCRDESGSALAGVVGLMLVIAVVSVAMLSASVASVRSSTAARADVQSTAAADAGIDVAFASIYAGEYLCTFVPPSTTTKPQYSATVQYKNSSGTVVSCTTSNSTQKSTVASATITSVGQSDGSAVGTTAGSSETVVANVSITQTSTTTGSTANPLTKLIYANGALNLINGATLAESSTGAQDASVYSAGATTCSDAGSTIAGSLTVQGNASFTNQCTIEGTVWASGTVTGDGAEFGEDIYSAGTGTVTLQNGAHVDGTVLADGPVTLQGSTATCAAGGSANVCGSVLAFGGALTLNNGSSIAASGYAKSGITLQDPTGQMIGGNAVTIGGNLSVSNPNNRAGIIGGYAKIQGIISGPTYTGFVTGASSSCQYGATTPFAKCSSAVTAYPTLTPARTFPSGVGYPTTATVNAPATESMPTIGVSSTDLAKWTSAGWTVVTVNGCTAGKSYIDGMTAAANGSQKTLLNVTNCTSQLTWESTQFTVYNNFAVINPGGFKFYNGTNGIKSSSSTKREVSLIVPTGSTGAISTDNVTFTNVYTMLYTPGSITMQNAVSGFSGQIYAGSITGPTSGSTLTMHQQTVPGATGSGSSGTAVTTITYSAAITSRLDVAGS